MKEQEVRNEYLKIARDRRAAKGDRTPGKRRLVKGRKGVGKFAGLMMAGVMRLQTHACGKCTQLMIRKADLRAGVELEALPLPIEVSACGPAEHGTEVSLSALEQNWNYRSPVTLSRTPR